MTQKGKQLFWKLLWGWLKCNNTSQACESGSSWTRPHNLFYPPTASRTDMYPWINSWDFKSCLTLFIQNSHDLSPPCQAWKSSMLMIIHKMTSSGDNQKQWGDEHFLTGLKCLDICLQMSTDNQDESAMHLKVQLVWTLPSMGRSSRVIFLSVGLTSGTFPQTKAL